MRKLRRERSWLLGLFGMPFFAIGLGFLLLSVIPTLYDGWRMAAWPTTTAALSYARLISSYSDGTTTYQVEAGYQYRVDSTTYHNDRVAISSSGDNIGDFQLLLGRRLEEAFRSNTAVTVYYNPDEPSDSVLDRNIRWGLLGVKLIFVLTFGGVGLGLIIFALRGKKLIDSPETADEPWLRRAEWADNTIRSGARAGLYVTWGFALFWNLVSAPAAFMFPGIWKNEGEVALLILLFPVVGILLLVWAIRKTLQWRRFGVTPLRLDPFPGSIGGDVAGEILLTIPFDPQMTCEVSLSNLYSYISGSGKNRSRHERVEWQDRGYARVERTAKGVRLLFRFHVPDGLRESEEQSDSYYLWRLSIASELPGVNLERNFEIPVYATAESSRNITFDSANELPLGMRQRSAESVLPLRRNGLDMELYYPMMRQPGKALTALLFGGMFVGAGLFIWEESARSESMLYLMGGIFTLIGGLVVLGGVYSGLNSLSVQMDGRRVTTVRRLLGFPIKHKTAAYSEIQTIDAKRGNSSSQQGGKHRIEYKIVASTANDSFVMAEQIDSHSRAKRVVEFFEEALKLKK